MDAEVRLAKNPKDSKVLEDTFRIQNQKRESLISAPNS